MIIFLTFSLCRRFHAYRKSSWFCCIFVLQRLFWACGTALKAQICTPCFNVQCSCRRMFISRRRRVFLKKHILRWATVCSRTNGRWKPSADQECALAWAAQAMVLEITLNNKTIHAVLRRTNVVNIPARLACSIHDFVLKIQSSRRTTASTCAEYTCISFQSLNNAIVQPQKEENSPYLTAQWDFMWHRRKRGFFERQECQRSAHTKSIPAQQGSWYRTHLVPLL